jgi:suppressor for copper-sensitivity B
MPRPLRFAAFLLTLAAVFAASPARAQVDLGLKFGGGDGLDDPLGATEVKFTLEPKDAKPGDTVTMKVDLTFPPDSHTYSQDKSFGGRTRITVDKSSGVTPLGEGFVPDHKPKSKDDPILGQVVEVFEKPVIWSRKFKIDSKAKLSDVLLEGKVRFQVCDANSCLPQSEKFSLRLAEAPKAVFENRFPEPGSRRKPVQWVVTLSPKDAKVGEKVTLKLAAKVDDGYHLFGLDQNPKNLGLPTRITESVVTGLKASGEVFRQDRKSEVHFEDDAGKKSEQRFHHKEVSFLRDYVVTEDGAAGYGIAGQARFQYCNANSCTPGKVTFTLGTVNANATPNGTSGTGATGSQGTGTSATGAVSAGGLLQKLKIREPGGADKDATLATYLLYAFLGGLILNVMPCVLPVIAIKVLSFVQQAGEDRKQILMLNATYSLGVVVVFLGLASMTVFFKWGWAGLFDRWQFNVGITSIVFVMALSLLGVFEIPIPGFVGNAAGTQKKEGPTGAFLTGVFATILATPCTGPFMGTALAWSVKQSPATIYMVWGMMGVGMATPYLLFGLFPAAVKYLPKPGNWMVTFKQICGFVLLGTVVFLLYGLSDKYVVPTLVLLLGLGLGLWMIGNLYNLASPKSWRWKMRGLSLTVTCLIAGLAYYMAAGLSHLKWRPYSEDTLAEAMLEEGNIVMVDFTADW